MSEWRRILFAVIAIPLTLVIVFAGGAALAALLAVAAALAAWEFYRLARAAGHAPLADVGCALAGLIPLAVHARYLGLVQPRLSAVGAVIASPVTACAVVLAVMAVALWMRGSAGRPLGAVATTLLGAIYTGGLLSFAYALRYHDYAVGSWRTGPLDLAAGGVLLGLPLVLTWATDTGAFLTGRGIGGRKLMPSVSPAKTVAGAIGGIVLCVIVMWFYTRFALRPAAQLSFTTAGAVLFAAVVSVTAQVGDLFESMLKREAGVKDSSTLIPGHGGALDRLDSLFFVLPVSHLMLRWLLVPAPR